MEVITSVLAWILGSLIPYTTGLQHFRCSPAAIAGLRSELSPNASVLCPGSKRFDNATTRWQTYKDPNITMVVEVATEKDVQVTIIYANKHEIPFLAVSGGHGAIDSLASVHHGIQIWMRKLNSIQIHPDGKAATMGGGLVSKEITDVLWAAGKQTVTGACECTGMLAPMLGGGHGWLQGRHGLSADNLIEARLVLANGSVATVSSKSHPDLFWAIRGAGHNFGIVTEFKYKIYDVPPKNVWTFESFIFTGDKVEQIYETTNRLTKGGKQPVEFINFSYFIRIPNMDSGNPVINYFVLYEGPPNEEKKIGKYFWDIGPLNVTSLVVSYPELSGLTGNGNSDPACQHGFTALRFPASFESYNVSVQRIVYEKFKHITSSEPAFQNSLFLFEGYSVQGVKAVPEESTAFPDRFNNILVTPVFLYAPNKSLDRQAIEAGEDIRETFRASSKSKKLHAYVNYAHGDETLQEMYGYPAWRVDRLKSLKEKYDPKGRFNFYAPIR